MNAHILSSQPVLPIGGITPFTTIDFPGRLAAVLYTQGCAWRCRYCYNSHLQPFSNVSKIPWDQVITFLESRKGFLDGVVFCGGEPTVHQNLPSVMKMVKAMGYEIGLHTTGIDPDRLGRALEFCDWVGMDIKAPFHCYEKITQTKNSGLGPTDSIGMIIESGVDYEFRTTVHPDLLSEKDVFQIAQELHDRGAKSFVLQPFRSQGCVDEILKTHSTLALTISQELKDSLALLFENFLVRE